MYIYILKWLVFRYIKNNLITILFNYPSKRRWFVSLFYELCKRFNKRYNLYQECKINSKSFQKLDRKENDNIIITIIIVHY